MWCTRQLASARFVGRCFSAASEQTRLGIIGVPFAKGQSKQGVELAPDLLRQSNLRQVLQSSDGESEQLKKNRKKITKPNKMKNK